jgi:hypothetical protein
MAKVIRKPKTNVFLSMCEDAKAMNENNDCTVKAITATTGLAYRDVHAALRRVGRKNGKGATIWQMQRACDALGFNMTSVPKQIFLSQYPKSNRPQNITTHHPEKYNKVWKDGRKYIFSTARHVAAVIDGTNHDWTVGRYLRVQTVYLITPKG